MDNKFFTSILLLLILVKGYSQPHIEGNLEININSGQIDCNFTLSNIPELKEYKILLNKGMNIKYFKDVNDSLITYDGYYDGIIQGEAIEYTFKNAGDTLPKRFNIVYKGAFPVYVNEYNTFDFKGIIAFNGQTVRAAEQTKWYPVIYDVSNDRLIYEYTYDINVSLINGTSIFINGSPPIKGQNANLKSKKAIPLLFFMGNYDFIENEGNFILNTSITKESARMIFQNIDVIKNELSGIMEMTFSDNIYLINHQPLNKWKEGDSWGFNTYPSFAFTGLDFNELVDEKGKFYNNFYKYFGHEFAHNYFGSNVYSGNLAWFWLESIPEYLSFNIVEDLCGKEFLKKVLSTSIHNIKDENFIPLDKIQKKEEINQNYRYNLGALLFKCFEDQFGREKTNKVLQYLLKFAETNTLTLNLWKESAIKSGVSKTEFEEFEKKYIANKNFKENIIEQIRKNYN